MKVYILVHTHKHGMSPYIFKSNVVDLSNKEMVDKDYLKEKLLKEELIRELEIDFTDNDMLEIFESVEYWKEIPTIKF